MSRLSILAAALCVPLWSWFAYVLLVGTAIAELEMVSTPTPTVVGALLVSSAVVALCGAWAILSPRRSAHPRRAIQWREPFLYLALVGYLVVLGYDVVYLLRYGFGTGGSVVTSAHAAGCAVVVTACLQDLRRTPGRNPRFDPIKGGSTNDDDYREGKAIE